MVLEASERSLGLSAWPVALPGSAEPSRACLMLGDSSMSADLAASVFLEVAKGGPVIVPDHTGEMAYCCLPNLQSLSPVWSRITWSRINRGSPEAAGPVARAMMADLR